MCAFSSFSLYHAAGDALVAVYIQYIYTYIYTQLPRRVSHSAVDTRISLQMAFPGGPSIHKASMEAVNVCVSFPPAFRTTRV